MTRFGGREQIGRRSGGGEWWQIEGGNEGEAFRGKGMTHLEEKMEVRLGSGDRNLSPCVWGDGLKGL